MIYHSYIFFSSDLEYRKLSKATQKKLHSEFKNIIAKQKKVITYPYATVGLKVQTNMLFWIQADSAEVLQDFINDLLHTNLGRYIQISHSLFGLTRPTQYSPKSTGHLDTKRKGGKYLIIYPFTKTTQWYQLDFETRRNLMGGHVSFGKKHPKIEQLLLYSYGIDNSEFIVSYETDDLLDFQTLVMELRSDKVRNFTLKDTPIFTGIYKPLDRIFEYL